jgi:hypothetical protein
MLTLKSSDHLLTNRHRASFRGCPTSTGVPAWRVEAARRLQEWIGLANRGSRRSWLEQLWSAHRRRLACQADCRLVGYVSRLVRRQDGIAGLATGETSRESCLTRRQAASRRSAAA